MRPGEHTLAIRELGGLVDTRARHRKVGHEDRLGNIGGENVQSEWPGSDSARLNMDGGYSSRAIHTGASAIGARSIRRAGCDLNRWRRSEGFFARLSKIDWVQVHRGGSHTRNSKVDVLCWSDGRRRRSLRQGDDGSLASGLSAEELFDMLPDPKRR